MMRTLQEWHQIKTHLWLREVLLTRPSLPEFLRVDLIPSHAGQPCRGPIIRLQQTGAPVRHTASYSFQANRQAIRKSQIAVSPDRIRARPDWCIQFGEKNGFANTFRALAVVIASLLSRYRQGVVHALSVTPITTAAIQDWIQNLAAIVLNVRHVTV